MGGQLGIKARSETVGKFAKAMRAGPLGCLPSSPPRAKRLNVDPDGVRSGLAQLVLTLVKLLHEILERQAVRRMEAGSLGEGEVEQLGLALLGQSEQIEELRKAFGLSQDDLNLDLGPLGRLF